ncbi:hypothetical protein L1987_36449 [Smallanthus sonchifolius]|uniref:Uncharacterized protein n=1 Tax=Smallanthus sonchifolius TaxID=185202 RepID=A0ACB9HF00_9ASTR|nr:hypothetical protein L1987_36449 [Smallanthus sonchifolius]
MFLQNHPLLRLHHVPPPTTTLPFRRCHHLPTQPPSLTPLPPQPTSVAASVRDRPPPCQNRPLISQQES